MTAVAKPCDLGNHLDIRKKNTVTLKAYLKYSAFFIFTFITTAWGPTQAKPIPNPFKTEMVKMTKANEEFTVK